MKNVFGHGGTTGLTGGFNFLDWETGLEGVVKSKVKYIFFHLKIIIFYHNGREQSNSRIDINILQYPVLSLSLEV